ncbi:MAG: 50S ribosomal protein L16, partial [Candidatus Aenigmarchaeota archaeon]|nr:50S ribosomal protein L16 [Candidatus Aenigmarchaeota archaeon]
RVYPHNILREHAQAAVAQADRFYDGMRKPFGKPTGRAARLKEGQPILTIRTNKKYEDAAKEAIRRAGMKIPVGFRTVAE